jgi:DNA modification methylase
LFGFFRKDEGEKMRKSTQKSEVFAPEEWKNALVHGDCLKVLKQIPDCSVYLCFTSPPYFNARDYAFYNGYAEYLSFLESVFFEVCRVLKEGRYFVLNTSPVLTPRAKRSESSQRHFIPFDAHAILIKLGFEFLDDIIWVKPDASAKNRNAGFGQHRKPLAYKTNPVTEYVFVYRKKSPRLIDWNMAQYDAETIEGSLILDEYERTNIWKIAPVSDPEHPAVFPPGLARRVIEYYSYKGDLVLDPFGGVGTVGQMALQMERNYLLIEREEKYVKTAKYRLCNHSLYAQSPMKFYEGGLDHE